jgi:hypothetical protein
MNARKLPASRAHVNNPIQRSMCAFFEQWVRCPVDRLRAGSAAAERFNRCLPACLRTRGAPRDRRLIPAPSARVSPEVISSCAASAAFPSEIARRCWPSTAVRGERAQRDALRLVGRRQPAAVSPRRHLVVAEAVQRLRGLVHGAQWLIGAPDAVRTRSAEASARCPLAKATS